jgi:uncharacterized protein (UPF0303 family)
MDIATLAAETNRLTLPRFAEAEALQLGLILIDLAQGMPVVINIRTANRCLFHVSLAGASANNDNWARRKSNTALVMGLPSMLVGLKNAARKRTLQTEGLSEADYADHGGAVPIRVTGVGMVAVCTVSGLPQEDDHRLVIRGLEAWLAQNP